MANLLDDQKRPFSVGGKLKKVAVAESQKLFNGGSRAIPAADPDHFGWMAENEAALMEVCIFGEEHEAMLGGILPDSLVTGLSQPDVSDVLRFRVFLLKRVQEPVGQVLIEEQFHRDGNDTSLRSRSAANSRHARMSSRVRSGKSTRISASVMPEARYSRTSYTVMRNPRIQGLPPRFAGSRVIRSW